jgi:histidinol-phosphate aminotransferase
MLKPRAAILALDPYCSPISSRDGLSLDLNENLAGCSPRVLARMSRLTTSDISRYPQREVGERLVAGFLGVTPEQVLLTNGADEALTLLFAAYLSESTEIILADPTFVMYPMIAQAFGAKLVRVPPDANFSLPTAVVLAAISPRTRVIAIANPNNPTGTAAPLGELLRIAQSAPDAAVLIDEAYFELHGQTVLPEVQNNPNLFVVRTLSKVYGLAGLRLGALIGPPEQIGYIRRFCPPFNVNAVVLACLEEALADQSFVSQYVTQMKQGRERIEKLCEELGLQYWPSATNFVLVRVGANATPFTESMQRRGFMIRDASGQPGCPGCVRITVPAGDQMDNLLAAMQQALGEVRTS